uniref:Secretory peptide n=1 Tax=Heteropoda venatoria TaxID=152925 RepID=A0A088BPC6_HETVE|nr:secretory peptide [Heteropoda venatoria]
MKPVVLCFAFAVIVSCFLAVDSQAQDQCIELEEPCVKSHDICCDDMKCKCYFPVVNGIKISKKCWCFEKDVIYEYADE